MVFVFTLEKEHLGLNKPSYSFGLLWVNKSLPSTSRTGNDLSIVVGFSPSFSCTASWFV